MVTSVRMRRTACTKRVDEVRPAAARRGGRVAARTLCVKGICRGRCLRAFAQRLEECLHIRDVGIDRLRRNCCAPVTAVGPRENRRASRACRRRTSAATAALRAERQLGRCVLVHEERKLFARVSFRYHTDERLDPRMLEPGMHGMPHRCLDLGVINGHEPFLQVCDRGRNHRLFVGRLQVHLFFLATTRRTAPGATPAVHLPFISAGPVDSTRDPRQGSTKNMARSRCFR